MSCHRLRCQISIRSPHTRGDCELWHPYNQTQISIHPLIRGETYPKRQSPCCPYFNPLPSYEGRRFSPSPSNSDPKFQSTPLMRGETFRSVTEYHECIFQSTPLMRGETKAPTSESPAGVFQSTPLMRGETVPVSGLHRSQPISIHSPHARGDARRRADFRQSADFNPLPSYEGRRWSGTN